MQGSSERTNFAASAYGRKTSGLIEYAVNNSGVLYQDPDIEKVRQLLARNGLQLPTPLKLSDYDTTISQSDRSVNSSISENEKMIHAIPLKIRERSRMRSTGGIRRSLNRTRLPPNVSAGMKCGTSGVPPIERHKKGSDRRRAHRRSKPARRIHNDDIAINYTVPDILSLVKTFGKDFTISREAAPERPGDDWYGKSGHIFRTCAAKQNPRTFVQGW